MAENSPVQPAPAPVVTHHDLLKTVALLLMLVDHIGFFFFPEHLEWRAIGRASAPIWLFLVGYNRKTEIDTLLWVCAGLMLLVVPLLTGNLVPLNILVTIILVRLTIPFFPMLLMPLRGFDRGFMPGVLLMAFALALYPAHLLWEYGMFAFMFAAWGWWCREAEDESSPYARYSFAPLVLAGAIFALYAVHYIAALQLNLTETLLMLGALLPVSVWLATFHKGPVQRPIGPITAKILHFCGRQTLLLYVVHYILLGTLRLSLQ